MRVDDINTLTQCFNIDQMRGRRIGQYTISKILFEIVIYYFFVQPADVLVPSNKAHSLLENVYNLNSKKMHSKIVI